MKSSTVSGKIKDNISDSCCSYVCRIIIQIFLWALIVGLILCIILIDKQNRNYIRIIVTLSIFLFFAYILYLLLAFSAPEWRFISNILHPDSIHEKMQSLFSNPLKVIFNATCYHYKYGNYGKTHQKRKVISHKDSEEFRYFCGRDISGIFILDSDKIYNSSFKSMLKLKLKIDFEYADEISQLDYNMQKDFFIGRNRPRDDYMEFIEEKLIDGFDEFNLINLAFSQPCFLNRTFYIIFTILTLVEFYKCYFNSICATQEFSIKKVISTRFDLNQSAFVKKYSMNDPKLVLRGNEHSFNNVHTLKERIYDLPTEEELNRAAGMNLMYEKKLSNYNINMENQSDQNNQNKENNLRFRNSYNYNIGMDASPNILSQSPNVTAPPIQTSSINDTGDLSLSTDTELIVRVSSNSNAYNTKELQTKLI